MKAVIDMVNAAFKLYGGEGDAEARVLRCKHCKHDPFLHKQMMFSDTYETPEGEILAAEPCCDCDDLEVEDDKN